jgi:hypothetical protein
MKKSNILLFCQSWYIHEKPTPGVLMRVNTKQALESISINPSAIKNLAEHDESKKVLRKYGVDPDNYFPLLAGSISQDEWVNLLRFYAEKGGYRPAQDLLKSLSRDES